MSDQFFLKAIINKPKVTTTAKTIAPRIIQFMSKFWADPTYSTFAVGSVIELPAIGAWRVGVWVGLDVGSGVWVEIGGVVGAGVDVGVGVAVEVGVGDGVGVVVGKDNEFEAVDAAPIA